MHLKVVSIAPYSFLPYQSGGQKLIALFNEYLGLQCTLTVIGTSGNELQLAKNYSLLPWLPNGLLKLVHIPVCIKLLHYLKTNKVQHLITEHPYLGWMGYIAKCVLGTRWIVHTHNIEFERFKQLGKFWWRVLKIYECWVLRKADMVFCISEEDRLYMVDTLCLPSNKCMVVPFGIVAAGNPPDKQSCRDKIAQIHHICPHEKILLFSGVLNYPPNLDALQIILRQINPLLMQQQLQYKIIICGKNLPSSFNELASFAHQNVLFAGYVADIDLYFKGADIFLNPISFGGGVKTKLIEALGCNTTVVSTVNGATGCDTSTCRNKLIIVPDGNWAAFAKAIQVHLAITNNTPTAFYDRYFWGNIASNVITFLEYRL